MLIPYENLFLPYLNSHPRSKFFTLGILEFGKIKLPGQFYEFQQSENSKNLEFRECFHFYPILDYYKIRTRKNFENSNNTSLDLHLIM